MAIGDYALCHICQGKAFYDANISDPRYCATWDPSEDCDPIGISVLCPECNKTHQTIIIPRADYDRGICPDCNGSGESGPDQICGTCDGDGAELPEPPEA